MEKFEKADPISSALAEIHQIEAEVMTMGANDSENSQFLNIKNRLTNREITPEEALDEARKIRSSKQDYH